MNRLAYIARFIYWLCFHRSWARAVWVMAHEGKVWK